MKVAVVGCGALGSFYGAKLSQAGCEVHFLLRSDYATVRQQGVRIVSPCGDFHVWPKSARHASEIGSVDLVVIGLKTYANDQFPILLPALVGPDAALLTLQNGIGNEERLAALFGPDRVMGGLCFVCLNRVEPGVIHHLAFGDVSLGEFGRAPQPRTEQIAQLFSSVGVPCVVTPNLERAHWEKLAWNIPFNGLGVASAAGYEAVMLGDRSKSVSLGACLTTDQLLADPQWEALVRSLMAEVIETARALGFDVPRQVADALVDRTRKMGAYKASTVVDFERGQPLELEALFAEPLRRAQRAKVSTPRLAALCRLLQTMNPPLPL